MWQSDELVVYRYDTRNLALNAWKQGLDSSQFPWITSRLDINYCICIVNNRSSGFCAYNVVLVLASCFGLGFLSYHSFFVTRGFCGSHNVITERERYEWNTSSLKIYYFPFFKFKRGTQNMKFANSAIIQSSFLYIFNLKN